MVRDWLYKKGVNIASKHMKDVLGPTSLIPTLVHLTIHFLIVKLNHWHGQSAFSAQLKHLGFNFYSLFIPDLLHEFELGVWKAVFTHLLRILYVHGEDAIQKLNWR